MPTSYLDFDLLIERTEERYRARVVDSPAGQATVDFQIPVSALEMENFILRIGRALGSMRRDVEQVRRLESSEREAIKAFGGRLFEAVFADEVNGCLRASLNEAFRRGAGLRIRLRLSDAPELANVPWEYLYNPSLNRFFSLSTETPLVRYLDLPEGSRALGVKPPLRILVMISSPQGYPQLDVAQEWDKLTEALAELEQESKVTLSRLPKATMAELQRELRHGEYHILHFIGHGGFVERAEDSALLMEDDQGRGRLVVGQDLGTILHGYRPLRLAVLNACEGARGSPTDPFAGVAQGLVQQGVPAVIAMQFEITDRAAITFAQEFYGALSDGYPVDTALAEARRAIFASGNEIEWATPVLHMRSPNGRLFKIDRRPAEAPAPQAATPPIHEPLAETPSAPEALVETPPAPPPEVIPTPPPEPHEEIVPIPEVAVTPVTPEPTAPDQVIEVETESEKTPEEPLGRATPVPAETPAPVDEPVVPRPVRPEEVRPVRGAGLPAAWWIVTLGGAALVAAGIVLPFGRFDGTSRSITGLNSLNVLEPLAAILGAVAAAITALNPRFRRIVKGVLIGFGAYAVLLYLSYTLIAINEYEALQLGSPTPAAGVFVGLVGGLLLLWAGLSLPAGDGPVSAASSDMQRFIAFGAGLVFLGVAVVVLATLALPVSTLAVHTGFGIPSLPWIHLAVQQFTLIDVASPFVIPPLGAAVVAGLSGYMVLRWPQRREAATGLILALAVEVILFNLTTIAGLPEPIGVGVGAYVGLLSGVTMLAGAILVFRATLRVR